MHKALCPWECRKLRIFGIYARGNVNRQIVSIEGVDKKPIPTYLYNGRSNMKKNIEFKLGIIGAHQMLLLKPLTLGSSQINLGIGVGEEAYLQSTDTT